MLHYVGPRRGLLHRGVGFVPHRQRGRSGAIGLQADVGSAVQMVGFALGAPLLGAPSGRGSERPNRLTFNL